MPGINHTIRRVSVLGAGQIGGSIWLRLAELGIDVVGWDPDVHVRAQARAMKLKCTDDMAEAIADSHIIFLAAPLSALPGLLAEVAPKVESSCIITDVGSTKTAIVNTAQELGCSQQFIGGHPMAGMEGSGIGVANPALFGGAAWVLALESTQQLDCFRTLAQLLLTGFGVRLVPLMAHQHDETVAVSSHLPHVLAGGLANGSSQSTLKKSILSLAAGSFRDGTRVASTLPERTSDMLWHNRQFLRENIRTFSEILNLYSKALEQEGQSQLQELFEQGFALRQELLARNMRQFNEKFDLSLDGNSEKTFLSEVGMAGGHIAECVLTDTMVAYNVWLPTSSS